MRFDVKEICSRIMSLPAILEVRFGFSSRNTARPMSLFLFLLVSRSPVYAEHTVRHTRLGTYVALRYLPDLTLALTVKLRPTPMPSSTLFYLRSR